MGDRWHLLLGGQQVRWGKNDIPKKILTVFQEADKYMHAEWVCRLEELHETWSEEDFTDIAREDLFGYRASVENVVARLRLMGFSGERCRLEIAASFDALRDSQVWIFVSGAKGYQSEMHTITSHEMVDVALRAYMKVLPSEGGAAPKLTDVEQACLNEFEFLFDEGDEDVRILLGALLNEQDSAETLTLDLHDLLAAGSYFTHDDALSAHAVEEMQEDTANTGPIIVITEGTFDSSVLSRALAIVRPDIAGYFTFWDPGHVSAQGGTGRVVANLRSFAAAGVMNRVIAILDNDAAGREAERHLANTPLPKHYGYILLPELDYAREWPTHGPSGQGIDDINGRASSVEFYFGKACLTCADGTQVPVTWKSLIPGVQEWQGELTDKRQVQKRIVTLLSEAESGGQLEDEPWAPMRKFADGLVAAAEPSLESLGLSRQ